jgi:hypothetical protein
VNAQEFIDSLDKPVQQQLRLHMIAKLQGTLQAVVEDRFETLKTRYTLQSVLKQVLEQKRQQHIRPLWGSW